MAFSWAYLQSALLQVSCPKVYVREASRYRENNTYIFVEVEDASVEWKVRQEEKASEGNG
jgi:hypothetical protein